MTKLQPPDWAEPKGYANGILARGALIFVGGQIGWNADIYKHYPFANDHKKMHRILLAIQNDDWKIFVD